MRKEWMMIGKAKGLMAVLVMGLGVAALKPAPGEAQLQEVRQTVFGMDCAPCAYAVERRMERLEGVSHVELSLNEGFAELRFSGDHGTTLEQIRRAIRESGFGPRDARVRLRGTVVLEDGAAVLETTAGERYRLKANGRRSAPEAGARVAVDGTVEREADEAGRWLLTVEHLEREGTGS